MDATALSAFAAVLLTYVVHSTLLLGTAWLADRWLVRGEAWRETVWKTALIGALVTTAVAAVLPARIAPRIEIAALADAPAAAASVPVVTDAVAARSQEHALPLGPAEGVQTEAEPGPSAREAASTESGAAAGVVSSVSSPIGWVPVLLVVWLVLATLLLIRLGVRHARLYRVLRGRREVTEAGLPAMLAELRRAAGVWRPVRLTSTPSIATPLVLGGSEICVPARFLTELSDDERRAALAHELGHLVRRDPAWQLTAMVLGCVFFFQPLHRVARLRLRESAEYLADGWAVRQTGSQLSLARCLAEVASWVAPSDEVATAGTLAMAEGGSPLMLRVRRLLDREPETAPRPALQLALALVLLAAAAGFAPAVGGGSGPAGGDVSGPSGIAPAGRVADEGGNEDIDVDHESDAELAVAGQELTVIRAPQQGSLQQRTAWAQRQAARVDGPYWIAWAVPSALPPGTFVSLESASGSSSFTMGPGSSINSSAGGLASQLRVRDEVTQTMNGSDIIVLGLMEPAGGGVSVDRLAVRSPVLDMRLSGRVYWLGRVDADEGVQRMREVYRAADDPRVAMRAVNVLALHDSPTVVALLHQFARNDAAPAEVRGEAVEGLRYHPHADNVRLLMQVARTDEDEKVRSEAAETLGDQNTAGVDDALRELIRTGDRAVRSEALESLAERGQDPALLGLLVQVALTDRDARLRDDAVDMIGKLRSPAALDALDRIIAESTDRRVLAEALDALGEHFRESAAAPRLEAIARTHADANVRGEAVDLLLEMEIDGANADALVQLAMIADTPEERRDVVEAIGELPADIAVPALRRIVFESGDETAERQAAESLGELRTTAALAVLDEIIARNPGEAASVQAVEAIGQNFPRDVAEPRLRRILAEHPSRNVRREAADQLEGIGG